MHSSPRFLIIIFLAFLLLPGSVTALNTAEAIQIKADHAELDEKAGLTTYSGDVELDQGDLRIRADKVVIKTRNNAVTEVIATGKPASYRDTENGKPLFAQGSTIHYQLAKDFIQLIENASLEQDGSVIRSERIDYDLKTRKVKARGDTGNNGKPERVIVTIPVQKGKADEE